MISTAQCFYETKLELVRAHLQDETDVVVAGKHTGQILRLTFWVDDDAMRECSVHCSYVPIKTRHEDLLRPREPKGVCRCSLPP